LSGGFVLSRRKKAVVVTNTETVTVEKEVIKEVEVEKEIIKEVPVEVVREVPVSKKRLPTDLSERERRVAELMLKGKSRREIADELNVSEGAVASYTDRVYMKAGVDNQKQFIARYSGETEKKDKKNKKFFSLPSDCWQGDFF